MPTAEIPTNITAETEIETERAREIDALRAVLGAALTDAQTALREAQHALGRLVGSDVYDIEYVEGMTAADLDQMVADAARATRIALVLKRQIEN
ncbi:hypothetical protein [Kitasatospora sp. NPDC057223]|uniref:hypothetical protein n=1 Tax=Kitasatospora sp. NPDC057223 TaxID=3346055 RepID=UPI0036436487